MRIINVSDPSSPFEAGYYDTLGNTASVAAAGYLIYVADEYTGLVILRHLPHRAYLPRVLTLP